MALQNPLGERPKTQIQTAGADVPLLCLAGCNQLLDESQVTLSFQDWLASVTERIHQTMHYQFEGKLGFGTTVGASFQLLTVK